MSSNSARLGRYDNVRLHVEYVGIAQLRADFRQTKKHHARQVGKLANSIDRTGFNVAILVDDELSVISGHAWVAATKQLGLDTLPVIRISHLSREQQRLFAMFDNKVTTGGTIDIDEVFLELSENIVEDPDIDLTDSGFEVAEIDAMRGPHETQDLDDLDDNPPRAEQPVSRVGDVWQAEKAASVTVAADADKAAIDAEKAAAKAAE